MGYLCFTAISVTKLINNFLNKKYLKINFHKYSAMIEFDTNE